MTPLEALRHQLAGLGLHQAEAVLEAHLESAAKEERSYADFLAGLLECETLARRERHLQTQMRMAHLPCRKTLHDFDFTFQPSLDRRQIRDLQTLRFVHEASNVLFLGPPGVGKTHLSIALAVEAIQAGFSAYFLNTYELMSDLRRAAQEQRLHRRMGVYLRPKVLVVDEMGYVPMDGDAARLFFQLVSARYEKGSLILTSNKSYGEWDSIFGDAVLATAILDRLLHHSTTINIRGESYRLKERRKAGLLSPPNSIPSEGNQLN